MKYFMLFVLGYFVLGTAYNKFFYQVTICEAIPHIKAIETVFGLTVDGIHFTIARLTNKNLHYPI